MKLHKSVIDELMYIVATYSGYEKETKMRSLFASIDLTPYERKENNVGETILVLTKDFISQLEGKKNR